MIYATEFVVEIDGGVGADELYGEVPRAVVGPQDPPIAPPAPPPSEGAGALTSTDCPGANPFYCGPGDQFFDGGSGNNPDIVYGERGNDRLRGGGGDDLLYGGLGDDIVDGEVGNDLLSGGFGFDKVTGRADNDLIRGDGTGDELLDGGGNSDTLSFSTGVTPGFPAGAVSLLPANAERGVNVNLGAMSQPRFAANGDARYGGGTESAEKNVITADFENIIGTPFDDNIVGSDSANVIYGGGGADVIRGMGGDDTLNGGVAGDYLAGGLGNDTFKGDAGSDFCVDEATIPTCDRNVINDPGGGVRLRDQTKVGFGFMHEGPVDLAPGVSYSQLFVSASNSADTVTATYSQAYNGADRVTFSSASGFDVSEPAKTANCAYSGPEAFSCTLFGGRLESIVVAGMSANDTMKALDFPTSVSVVVLGGEGGDELFGGDTSEDVIVDGPGPGNDIQLVGGGRSDVLLNNNGEDRLFGGNEGDLLISAALCDNHDELGGGASDDNASWAQLSGSEVAARLDIGRAGHPAEDGPTCGASAGLDQLAGIEDLEGSDGNDTLFGDNTSNDLLGRPGADIFFGLEGLDFLDAAIANGNDVDQTINCGEPNPPSPGEDVAIFEPGDPVDSNCEIPRPG